MRKEYGKEMEESPQDLKNWSIKGDNSKALKSLRGGER